MNDATRSLIRAVVKLVDEDVQTLSAGLESLDTECVKLVTKVQRLDARVAELEAALADNANHSRIVHRGDMGYIVETGAPE